MKRTRTAREAIDAVTALMFRRDGVCSWAQAIAEQMTDGAIASRLNSGSWRLVHGCVLVAKGAPLSYRGRCRAAVLAVGGKVAVAGRSAARLREIRSIGEPIRVHVIVPATRRAPTLDGVTIRRVRDWNQRCVVVENDLPLTGQVDTVADLARELGSDSLLAIVQDEAFHRRIDPGHLLRRCGRGRKGSSRLRGAVADWASGHASVAQRAAYRIAVRAGLPAPICGAVLPDIGEMDLVWEEEGVVGEMQGMHHAFDRVVLAADARKRNAIVARGLVLLVFTPDDVRPPARAYVAALREQLRLRRGWRAQQPQDPFAGMTLAQSLTA